MLELSCEIPSYLSNLCHASRQLAADKLGQKAMPKILSSLLHDTLSEATREDKLITETSARVASHVLCLCLNLTASSASFDCCSPSSREPPSSGHIPATSTFRPADKRRGHVPHGTHLRIIATARSEQDGCSRLSSGLSNHADVLSGVFSTCGHFICFLGTYPCSVEGGQLAKCNVCPG